MLPQKEKQTSLSHFSLTWPPVRSVNQSKQHDGFGHHAWWGWESPTETWLGLRAKSSDGRDTRNSQGPTGRAGGTEEQGAPRGPHTGTRPRGPTGSETPPNDQSATELPNKTVLVIPAISEKGEHRTATEEQKEQMCVFY